ncbi:MAG TPA: DUF202 domain-containing protein, partial [Stellaceae bacterium]|nr:DUF202 domain-containing protein [Stellaceae bacterium]
MASHESKNPSVAQAFSRWTRPRRGGNLGRPCRRPGRPHDRQAPDAAASNGETMIKSYSDHAANERTFLAWLRTGLSVVAFGFVIERLNLFIAELGQIIPSHAGSA